MKIPPIDSKVTHTEIPKDVRDFMAESQFETFPPDSLAFDDGFTLSVQDHSAPFPHSFHVYPSHNVRLVRSRAAIYVVYLQAPEQEKDRPF